MYRHCYLLHEYNTIETIPSKFIDHLWKKNRYILTMCFFSFDYFVTITITFTCCVAVRVIVIIYSGRRWRENTLGSRLCTHSLSALVWEMMKSPYGKIQCDLSKRQKGHMESVKWMKANDYLNLYLINNHLSHNIMDTISHFPLTQAGWQRLYCFLRQLYGRVCLKGSLRCALNCSEPVKALLRSLDLDDNTFLEILSVWNNAIGMV